ncbi:MAG: T9SS type A sorting domain-containing protein, partial [Saprospiraceae bacterium]
PNTVAFFVLNHSFSFCTDTGLPGRPSYYEFGDTLCATGHEWGVDSLYTIGCFGGWNCTYDTASINNKYIAYRKTSTGEIGWINVSMSLYSGNEPRTITFKINELLALYLPNDIDNVENDLVFDVIPNPTIDGRFKIISDEIITGIEIFNSVGQRIKSVSENDMDVSLPESKGLYIVRIRNEKGLSGSRRVVRL